MSGCCKDSSALMQHGANVGKLKNGSKVCGLVNTKGSRDHGCDATYKCGNETWKLSHGMNVSPSDNGWTAKRNWSLTHMANLDHLTMQCKMSSCGKVTGWVDWGALGKRDDVAGHSTGTVNPDGTFSMGYGVVVTKPNWGFLGRITKDGQEKSTYADNFWWKSGKMMLGWQSSCKLEGDFAKKGSMALQYNVNPDLTAWLGCCVSKAVAGALPTPDLNLSVLWKPKTSPLQVGVCVKRVAEDGSLRAGLGMKHSCADKDVSVAVDCDLNAKVSWAHKVSEHVKVCTSLAVPSKLLGGHGNWKRDLQYGTTMSLDMS